MNRIEFMEELSGLLQDIPEEDRMDALNYYNDYFDDAGAENEKNVIDELESPEKVAAKIKADREDPEDGKAGMPMEQLDARLSFLQQSACWQQLQESSLQHLHSLSQL